MSRRILFFQSKIALAIIGTVLIGSGAAFIAAASFSARPNQASTNQSQQYVNISTSGDSPATPTPPTASATPSPTPTPGKSPTATPTATPRPPTPTPTTGNGQANTLYGTVTSINTAANLFTVRSGGVTKTVAVTSQTTFTGACTSLSGMNTGWQVRVHGTYQSDGSFAATSVYSSFDN